MWLGTILKVLLILGCVMAIFLVVQYQNNGWPFKDDRVVNDLSFRVEKSSVENLLVNGNVRQLWAKVYSIADDPKLPDAVRLEHICLLYTSPSPRDRQKSRMPSSA